MFILSIFAAALITIIAPGTALAGSVPNVNPGFTPVVPFFDGLDPVVGSSGSPPRPGTGTTAGGTGSAGGVGGTGTPGASGGNRTTGGTGTTGGGTSGDGFVSDLFRRIRASNSSGTIESCGDGGFHPFTGGDPGSIFCNVSFGGQFAPFGTSDDGGSSSFQFSDYSGSGFRPFSSSNAGGIFSTAGFGGSGFRPFADEIDSGIFSDVNYAGSGYRPFSDNNTRGVFDSVSYGGSNFHPFAEYGEGEVPQLVQRQTTRQDRFTPLPGSSTNFPRTNVPNRDCPPGDGPDDTHDGGIFGPIPDTFYCGIFGPVPTLEEYLPRAADFPVQEF